MTRVLLFLLVVIPCEGFSSLQWIWRFTFHKKTMNLQDHGRVLHAFGILDPRIDLIWKSARDFHTFKDVGSEWGKIDVQRAVKFLCMIIMFWVLVSVALAIALILLVLLGSQ